MKTRSKIFWSGLMLLLALGLAGIGNVLAAVSTDQGDYIPGSVVTISGDNSDGAGYLAGETVHVDVSGPNGYAAGCDAIADDNGSWSCQVTLAGDDTAIGDYSYTATGQDSGISQSGTFTDKPPVAPPMDLNIYLNNDTAPKGEDCPDDGLAYWHFVASPNDGTVHFIMFYLNLGDGVHTITTFVLNGTQEDNVFVAVPVGYMLTSLDKSGSSADIHWDGGTGNQPDKFQLSHVCPGGQKEATPPTVRKDAAGSFDNTYTWAIDKDVDQTGIKQSTVDAKLTYTVIMTPDAGTVSNVKVAGKITITNPNPVSVTFDTITDQLSDGTVCTVADDWGSYECDLVALPVDPITNTVTIAWSDQMLSDGSHLAAGSASFTTDPIVFTENAIDECVSVNDPLDPEGPRTFCVGDPVLSFSYERTVTGTPGTCTDFDNTAAFTTNDISVTGSAGTKTELCVGADLMVTKDATPTFTRTYNWDIIKGVDPELVEQFGGTTTFNYTVTVTGTGYTDSAWAIAGTIHVVNPNDWEAITFDASDAVPGGDCSVTGGTNVTVAASGSVDLLYSCTFSTQPDYNTDIVNTATGTWDNKAYYTPSGSVDGMATFQFTAPTTEVNKTITVKDNFDGTETTLGTVDYPGPGMFNYSHTVNVPIWNCVFYDNTATIVETGQSVSQRVEVCGPAKTGALTMGFWQNKNGQGIIGSYSGMDCQGLRTWLNGFNPFADLTATNCTGVKSYISNVIKAANASGASMNAMLKAQMLATALDVYFSDPANGNPINAPAAIGGVSIDLTKICTDLSCNDFEDSSSVFGGSPKTVLEMLSYAANQSNVGGSMWYGNLKATQELAKDAFDAINNQKVFAP